MRYLADIPGCTAVVEVESGGLVTGPKLFVNDVPARKGLGKREYLLPGEDGEELVARMKQQFIDPVPALEVNGQLVRVVPAFTWEWILVGLPFLFVIGSGGGFIGGLLGGLGSWAIASLFRSKLSTRAKIGLSTLITVAILGAGLTIRVVVQLAVDGMRTR